MKKTFMLLAIACALLMSVPAVASTIEFASNDSTAYNTAQPDVQAASLGQVQISRDIADVACTSEVTSIDSFGALSAYTFISDTASAGTQQRSEVAAGTRALAG